MDDDLLVSAGASALFHSAVLAVVIFGLPGWVEPLEPQPMIPIELVELKDFIEETPVAPEPEPEEEPVAEEEAPIPEKQYEPKQLAALPKLPAPTPEPPAPDPESVPDPSNAPETSSQPAPEPAVSVPPPRPKPKPEPEPEPEKIVEDTSDQPPTPRRKPQLAKLEVPKDPPKEKDEPNQQSSLISSILKDLEKKKEEEPPQPQQVAKAETQAETQQSSVFEQMALVRHIQEQMRRCWRLEPGARNAEDLIVRIIVYLNSDGTVRKAEIEDYARATSDSFYRSAAENALRAVHTCSPFEGLPIKRYQVWRELHLTFNPSEMFGS